MITTNQTINKRILPIFFLALLLFSILGAFLSLSPASARASKLQLSHSSATLTTGESLTLKLLNGENIISPSKVKFQSSNKSIASVNTKGKISALKKGSATISATYQGKTYKAKITVKNASLSASSVSLELTKTETISLKNAVGKKISSSKVTFKSKNKSIATVSKEGVIKGISTGKTTITATYKGKTYSCSVTVSNLLLYSKNGIKIYYKGLSEDYFYDVNLCLKNNSKRNITIYPNDTAINGYMIDGSMWCEMLPGKKANDSISFWSSDLRENNITKLSKIKKIEVSFCIIDTDTWDDICETPVLTIRP